MNDHELRRARRAVRAFGWLAVLFGLLLMAWTWQTLELPDVELPERQPAGDYVEPRLPLRFIPEPF